MTAHCLAGLVARLGPALIATCAVSVDDFNWQLSYEMSLKVPKSTRMRFEFRYDNSVNNKYNPDPNRWVYQGFQSWEEMMAPNLGFLLDREADVGGLMSVSN